MKPRTMHSGLGGELLKEYKVRSLPLVILFHFLQTHTTSADFCTLISIREILHRFSWPLSQPFHLPSIYICVVVLGCYQINTGVTAQAAALTSSEWVLGSRRAFQWPQSWAFWPHKCQGGCTSSTETWQNHIYEQLRQRSDRGIYRLLQLFKALRGRTYGVVRSANAQHWHEVDRFFAADRQSDTFLGVLAA